jgi:hypothetical protein
VSMIACRAPNVDLPLRDRHASTPIGWGMGDRCLAVLDRSTDER